MHLKYVELLCTYLCMASIIVAHVLQLLPYGIEDLIETSVELAVLLSKCSEMACMAFPSYFHLY